MYVTASNTSSWFCFHLCLVLELYWEFISSNNLLEKESFVLFQSIRIAELNHHDSSMVCDSVSRVFVKGFIREILYLEYFMHLRRKDNPEDQIKCSWKNPCAYLSLLK